MGADHRKPAVAFVVLALVAAALVGSQRAEAQHGRLLAAIAVGGQAEGIRGFLPDPPADAEQADGHRVSALGPMVPAPRNGDENDVTRETMPSLDATPALGAARDRGAPERTAAEGASTTGPGAGSEVGAEPGTRTHRRAAEVAERARQGRLHGLATAGEARRKGIERRVAARANQVPPVAGRGRGWDPHAHLRPPTSEVAPSQSTTQDHPGGRGHDKLPRHAGRWHDKVRGLVGQSPGKKHGNAGQSFGRKHGAGQGLGKRHGSVGQGLGKRRGHAGAGPGNRRGR